MEHIDTSVLVIGRSGTGKSSLLNYLFGKLVERAGAGRPVTPRGIFKHSYEYSDALTIHIYDTWGLEPDKAEEWGDLINEEVARHDAMRISDWFNTVIFCISSNSDRVEYFEAGMIKELIDRGNNVVVAITHCNSQELSENAEVVEKLNNAGVSNDRIINVSSVSETLLCGVTTRQFGRDEVFSAILKNLWGSICVKLPANIRREVHLKLTKKREEQLGEVNGRINARSFIRDKLNRSPSQTLEEFGGEVTAEMEQFVRIAQSKVRERFVQANDYYFALYRQYNALISEANRLEIRVDMKCDFFEGYRRELGDSFSRAGFIDIVGLAVGKELSTAHDVAEVIKEIAVGLKINWASVRNKRRHAQDTINKCYDDLEQALYEQIEAITSSISKMYLLK